MYNQLYNISSSESISLSFPISTKYILTIIIIMMMMMMMMIITKPNSSSDPLGPRLPRYIKTIIAI